MAVRRSVAFLDVSSLNLAALQSAATFFARVAQIMREKCLPVVILTRQQFLSFARQHLDQHGEIGLHGGETGCVLDPRLVHVQPSGDLDL
jgi:hypothetical protein